MKKAEIIISEFSNPTREGITLHLNSPARLKTGTGAFKEHWVSWDKIGKLLFNNYTDKIEVSERDKLRLKLQQQEVSADVVGTFSGFDTSAWNEEIIENELYLHMPEHLTREWSIKVAKAITKKLKGGNK